MAKYRVAVMGHTGRGNYGHGIDRVWLDLPRCEVIAVADACEGHVFRKLSVKVRPEVVTLGLPEGEDIDPRQVTGVRLSPGEFELNAITQDGSALPAT